MGGTAEIASLRNRIMGRLPFLGGFSYIISLAFGLLHFTKQYDVKINDISVRTRLLISMVGKYFGAGIRVLNHPNYTAKNIGIIFVKDISFGRFIVALLKALFYGVENSKVAEKKVSHSVDIESMEFFNVEIDGEVYICKKNIELKRSEEKYVFYNDADFGE
jgi:diacylglycerol kinase family enzyme